MSDHQKATASSAFGNDLVPDSFMREMASRGTAFADTYSTSPICTPSRTSVMTGVHPLVHQGTCHQNRAPYNLPQLAELVQDAGYYTVAAGHYEHDRNLTRGWHEQISFMENGVIAEALAGWYANGRKDVGWSSGTNKRPPEDGHAYRLTSRVINALDGIVANDAPFFLHVPYLEPHPPYFASPPFDTMVDPESIPLPDQGGDGRPSWQAAMREQVGTDKATEDDIRKMIAMFYGMIGYVDGQMRRLRDAMDERGLLENTWFIISVDHGDYTGEKGLFTKGESLYETLLHIPLIVVPPEGVQWQRGQTVSGLVDHVDLFPTILGLAEATVPDYAQGHDLLSWVRNGASEPLRETAFAQVGDYHGNLGTTMPSGIPAAGRHPSLLQGGRTSEFSYVRDPDYGDEAYDLQRDPRELVNLLNDGAAGPAEVDRLRQQVDKWEEECIRLRGELGVVPGYRGFDQ